MDPTKIKRSNAESIRKPYRSTAATYEDYKKEIPDDDYYGLKHSEFKRPWLDNDGGYDEMEYKWDFPLEFLKPDSIIISPPDPAVYPFPGPAPWNPDWWQPEWNPRYPIPKPRPNPQVRKDPNTPAENITWDCDAPSFDWCPGELLFLDFVEAWNNPITDVTVEGDEGQVVAAGGSNVPKGSAVGTRRIGIRINNPLTDDRTWVLNVTATTQNGMTCVASGMKRGGCLGCSTEAIQYTSLQMPVNTSQTLTLQNPQDNVIYEWILTGGGSLSEQFGNTTSYTAPASNAGCADKPAIEVRMHGSEEVCDSITLTIYNPAQTGNAYYVYLVGKCGWIEYQGPACWQYKQYYTCAGAVGTQTGGDGHSPDCDMPPCNYIYPNYTCTDKPCSIDGQTPGTVHDVRLQAQIDGGCCPAALM